MSDKKRELKNEYKQNHRPMGVFQIRCLANDKVFVGMTLNLPGIINRHQFELLAGTHKNRALLADWQQFGAEQFVFEVLDELTPNQNPGYDYRADLAALEDLWLEKLTPYDERGYNERKKNREQRLRMIARNSRDRAIQPDTDEGVDVG